jgi:GNAT superfamily N-acetyltransferase
VPPTGDLVDAAASPFETLRLLEVRRAELRRLGLLPDPEAEDPEPVAVREGRLAGQLFVGPQDEAAGLVLWTPLGTAGRKGELFLLPGFHFPGTFGLLLERAEATPGLPILKLEMPTLGLAPASLAPWLEPLGFRYALRLEMRFPLDRPLPPVPSNPPGLRPLTLADEARLADLLQGAYEDSPLDPALLDLGQERTGEFERAVRELLHGTYGRWWERCSFGVERGGELVAATLVNDYQGPLIAEVVCRPSCRRQGLATALLRASLEALRREGAPTPRLAVTGVNTRARRLYRSLGFVEVAYPEENKWVNFPRAGRPELLSLLPSLLGN